MSNVKMKFSLTLPLTWQVSAFYHPYSLRSAPKGVGRVFFCQWTKRALATKITFREPILMVSTK